MRAFMLALILALPAGGKAADFEESLAIASDNAGQLRSFVEAAARDFGPFGKRAAEFLVKGMPETDLRQLGEGFLMENLTLAMRARDQFAWTRELPEEVFFNEVLPYASLDETREAWRAEYYHICRELVKDCKSSSEAAQMINKEFFKVIGVHYHTGRKAPNQSPSESKEWGKASCTGLSIILVDACRSVGVPARIAGTALWSNKRGNHTWVEIYDGGEWFFTGADEFHADGLNKAWFVEDASKALKDDWKHAIWASSWSNADGYFPLAWDRENRGIPAVNVTDRYALPEKEAEQAVVHLRVWDRSGGERLALPVEVLDAQGKVLQSVKTKAGTSDLNDMASISVEPGRNYRLSIRNDSAFRLVDLRLEKVGELTQELYWDEMEASVEDSPLSRNEAIEYARQTWKTMLMEPSEDRKKELEGKVVKAGGKEMKYLEKHFGEAPAGERSLYISMHGGGGAPPRVNDQQWQNQIRLYAPEEGIVVAPRAPSDTWNLWHEDHIDALFDRLIGNFVLERGVDPDRVFLMGYSAGGDGVYQLAPRMADRFAAAAMMAGHPNGVSPLGLRNLPFMIFMGGNDSAYKRNKIAAEWEMKLGALREADPGGYEHQVTIYEGLGHWMNGRDAEALPWMARHRRNAWPKKVVWHQSGRTHDRFYWLSLPEGVARQGQTIRAEVTGQEIEVKAEGLNQLVLRLNDELLDLDQMIVVRVNGAELFRGNVEREKDLIRESLRERPDLHSVAFGRVELKF
ncbi:transglutaminase domain-containing protein [Haloferula chungangensis]|uniref:Transglutaminase domain-containing protein n=1 Tax=Haloferula chungangensis TaxID=1048331 RepID=A0ABW2LBG5_9BACT